MSERRWEGDSDEAYSRFKPIFLKYLEAHSTGQEMDLTVGEADTAEFRGMFFKVVGMFAKHDLQYLSLIRPEYLQHLIRRGYIQELELDQYPFDTPHFRSLYCAALFLNFIDDHRPGGLKDMTNTPYNTDEFARHFATLLIYFVREINLETGGHGQEELIVLMLQYLRLHSLRGEPDPDQYPFDTAEFRKIYECLVLCSTKELGLSEGRKAELLSDESYAYFITEFRRIETEDTLPEIWTKTQNFLMTDLRGGRRFRR